MERFLYGYAGVIAALTGMYGWYLLSLFQLGGSTIILTGCASIRPTARRKLNVKNRVEAEVEREAVDDT
jgi:hypothetical protein